jgi:2-dehydropantoate 2-reductase
MMNPGYQYIKRVCIYGTGGVGGYYGGKIAEAFQKDKSGREIYFIARGDHLKALQQQGITVKTPERTIRAEPAKATQYFDEIPAPDLILLCTKSLDLVSAVESIKAKTTEQTVIIPLLNGMDIYQRIRSCLEAGIVLPACVYLGTHIAAPGVIEQSGGNGIILSGPDPRFPSYDAGNVRLFFKEQGIGFEWNESPYPAIWEKFIFIAAFGLVTAYSGKTLGEVTGNEKLNDKVRGIMQEIVSIAAKKGVKLPDDMVERSIKKAGNFPQDAKTSFQRDVELWPKPNEGDLYGGAILREGAALGIPTPYTETAYTLILQSLGKV